MARAAANKIQSVRAVDRAIQILQAFSPQRPSMSVLEIQKEIRLSRPTVYRLLETLASHGLIRVHGTPQRFSLDYGIGQLAQNWVMGLDVLATAQPIIKRLNEDTKETVCLNVLRGIECVCVLELQGPHALTMSRGIGPRDQLWRGASGKAMLPFLPEADLDVVLRTAPKGTDRKALMEELAAIRRNGFCVTRSEIFTGAVGIAAPYFDHSQRVAGSIIVTGPEARFSEDQVAKTARRVADSAAELSAVLGYSRSREKRR